MFPSKPLRPQLVNEQRGIVKTAAAEASFLNPDTIAAAAGER